MSNRACSPPRRTTNIGGMQLPCVIEMAANAFFTKASVAMGGYAMLTSGNANLLMAHGTPAQREVFAKKEFAGRWFGTMCLSEPQAGSSLSDVATRAAPDGDGFEADPLGPRYRLQGQQDVDLGRRARNHRKHRAPGAGQDCQGRRQLGAWHARHFAVHRAEEDGQRRRRIDWRAQRRGTGRAEPQARLPRHHQHAAEFRRRQVQTRSAVPVPSATWSATPARDCAACST